MRGLKLPANSGAPAYIVASFTDAWIETEQKSKLISEIKSHLLQMRGLKQAHEVGKDLNTGRIFYRCVD